MEVEIIIRSPTCRIIRLFAKHLSLQIYPTLPASDLNGERFSLFGVNAIEPIIPTIFASPTSGCVHKPPTLFSNMVQHHFLHAQLCFRPQ